jgi:hypothetical protein
MYIEEQKPFDACFLALKEEASRLENVEITQH